jgi:hypothetical protein
MSEKVYQAIGVDLCRRMRNWARWWDASVNGSVGPSSLVAAELGTRVDRYREAESPLLFGEGRDTEIALRDVPDRYQQIIRKFWLNEGKGLRWNSRQRGIEHHTMATWLIHGHKLLRAALTTRTAYQQTRAAAARVANIGA